MTKLRALVGFTLNDPLVGYNDNNVVAMTSNKSGVSLLCRARQSQCDKRCIEIPQSASIFQITSIRVVQIGSIRTNLKKRKNPKTS